jgi:hypothetical protein
MVIYIPLKMSWLKSQDSALHNSAGIIALRLELLDVPSPKMNLDAHDFGFCFLKWSLPSK